MSPTEVQALVIQLNEEMLAHAESLEFEEAAKLRDKIAQLHALLTGEKPSQTAGAGPHAPYGQAQEPLTAFFVAWT